MASVVPNFERADARLWFYRARISRVVDGDTVIALIDTGFGTFRQEYLRLQGIDAPELRPRTGTPEAREREKIAARKARKRVIELCEGREVIIRAHKTGKFGRWLATIYVPPEDAVTKLGEVADPADPPTVNQILLDEGLAKRFPAR